MKDIFMKRTLKEMSYPDYNWIHKFKHDIEYSFNSQNYRTNEFKNEVDLLTLGDSQTFGFGIEREQSWPEMLAKKNNFSLINLAIPGDSAQAQVTKAFEYFKKYGNPKIIIGSFHPYRIEFPIVDKFWELDEDKNTNPIRVSSISIDENFQEVSKAPHKIHKIMTSQMALFYTHTFLNILEQYCKSNNILFMYNFWNEEFNKFPKSEILKRHSKNYFVINNHNNLNCHLEHSDEKFFYHAADYKDKDSSEHWSYHKHIHISEMLHNKINGGIIL